MRRDGAAPAPSWPASTRGPAGLYGRIGRATAFALPGCGLAVGGHRLAGGAVSPGTASVVLLAFVVLGLTVAGRRERSGRFVATLVLGSQLAGHLLLAAPMLSMMLRRPAGGLTDSTLQLLLLCGHGPHQPPAAAMREASRALNVDDLRRIAAGAGAASAHAGSQLTAVLSAAAPMLGAHLVAAAVLAWWLRRGERALWAAARRVVVTVTALVHGTPVIPVGPRVRIPTQASRVARANRWLLPLSRRGPPLCCAPVSSCC